VFATEQHVEVEATWGVYQRIVAAYRNHDRAAAKTELKRIIATITAAVPTALTELITLGRTLKRRAADVLAYFDRAGTSNGPTEAICECRTGWSGTGWSGWSWSCRSVRDSRSN
jgi:transposase